MNDPGVVPTEDATLPPLRAVDTTFLLCANSALIATPSGFRDDEARAAFAELFTHICNGKRVNFVRPGGHARTTADIMSLVPSRSDRKQELSDRGNDELYAGAAKYFLAVLRDNGGARRVARWVRFQFDDPVMERIFFEVGETDQQGKLLEALHHLRRLGGEYQSLLTTWKPHASDIRLPDDFHRRARSAKEFGSDQEYTLSYAFFGFAKGLFYPLQLSAAVEQRHFTHWLRRLAQEKAASDEEREGGRRAIEKVDPPIEGTVFRWGDILLQWGEGMNDPRAFVRDELPIVVTKAAKVTTRERLASILAPRDRAERRRVARAFVQEVLEGTSGRAELKQIDKILAGVEVAAPVVGYTLGEWAGAAAGGLIARTGARLMSFSASHDWFAGAKRLASRFKFSQAWIWFPKSEQAVARIIDDFLDRHST